MVRERGYPMLLCEHPALAQRHFCSGRCRVMRHLGTGPVFASHSSRRATHAIHDNKLNFTELPLIPHSETPESTELRCMSGALRNLARLSTMNVTLTMTSKLSMASELSTWSALNMTSELNMTSASVEEYLESLSQAAFLKLLPSVFFIAILIALGIPGNLLVFVVYVRYFGPSTTRVFVLVMAVVDFLVMSVCLPLQIVFMRSLRNAGDPWTCKAQYILQQFAILMSAWLLVCVALDRHRRVCQPLKRQLSPKEACYLLLLPFTIAGLVNFPFVHVYGHRSLPTDLEGAVSRVCAVKNEYAESTVVAVHSIAMMGFLLLGVVSLVASYTHVLCKVQMLKRRRTEMKVSFLNHPRRDGGGKHAVTSDDNAKTSTTTPDHEEGPWRNFCCFDNDKLQVVQSEGALGENTSQSTKSNKNVLQTDSNSQKAKNVNNPLSPTIDEPEANSRNNSNTLTRAHSQGHQLTEESQQLHEVAQETEGSRNRVKMLQSSENESLEEPKVNKSSIVQCRLSDRSLYSRTTAMMLALTITFVVTFVPYFILSLTPINPVSLLDNALYLNLFWIGHLFLNVNSVVNPFIYSFLNPKFRLHCHQLFCDICKPCSSGGQAIGNNH